MAGMNLVDETEIKGLSQRYGIPQRYHADIAVDAGFWVPWEGKWASRRGEVMFLLPRPGGLLLHRKQHYPPQGWRLLTGGIDTDESVSEALQREVVEEVGLVLPVRRYVGVIDYTLDYEEETFAFVTHIFLMGYSDAPLQPSHDDEISAVTTVSLRGLSDVADRLDHLTDPDWRSWGAFRAVAHRRVAEWVGGDEMMPSWE